MLLKSLQHDATGQRGFGFGRPWADFAIAGIACFLHGLWIPPAGAQPVPADGRPAVQAGPPNPIASVVGSQDGAVPTLLRDEPATMCPPCLDEPPERQRLWSFEFGVAIISDNTPGDYLSTGLDRLDGPGGGLTYNFTVARQLHEFDWRLGPIRMRPQVEAPFRLTLIDENTDRFIPDLNFGLSFRWRDFPWNRFLHTTLAVGGGLSYSFEVMRAEIDRHPGEERSRLKFWLPIEFTLAVPRWREHQLVAFIDHQSGGTLFDWGGVDCWGLGYRFEF